MRHTVVIVGPVYQPQATVPLSETAPFNPFCSIELLTPSHTVVIVGPVYQPQATVPLSETAPFNPAAADSQFRRHGKFRPPGCVSLLESVDYAPSTCVSEREISNVTFYELVSKLN